MKTKLGKSASRRLRNFPEIDKVQKRLKKNFNKYIQLRDLEEIDGKIYAKCYTCNSRVQIHTSYDLKKFHAGHAWKDVYYSSVEFDERAVKGQCYKCNVYLNGNESIFHENLRKEFGDEEYEKLLLDKNQIKKWLYTELEKLNKIYLQKIKVEKERLKVNWL